MADIIRWAHKNLFSSLFNTVLTFLLLYVVYLIVPPLLRWSIINANFFGSGPDACNGDGACWVFIAVRFNQFMYGFYPLDQQWRINIAYVFLITNLALLITSNAYNRKWYLAFLLLCYPIIAFILFDGGILGLKVIGTYQWGGLHLTLIIALTGMAAALPLGILLALGRRSKLPAIRWLSIAFIELWRGVPLISVLFMASVMLPLFLPGGVKVDKLLRALIGIALFASAYMAEVVRGGLQSVPKGQYEAAQSLGFNYWNMHIFIILPQALRLVIPNIINTFIALFKDTTLVLIIGLFDFLGMVQAANADPKWLAYGLEGYAFAAIVFWIFCFGLSRFSMHIENRLRIGNKNE